MRLTFLYCAPNVRCIDRHVRCFACHAFFIWSLIRFCWSVLGHFGAFSHGALLRNVERGEALFAQLETPEYNMGEQCLVVAAHQ